MNDNFFSKNEPAVHEHHYHTTKKQYEDIHNIDNIDKSKSYKIDNHNSTDTHYYNEKASYHKPFNELHNQKE